MSILMGASNGCVREGARVWDRIAPIPAWVNAVPVLVLAALPLAVAFAVATAEPDASALHATPLPSLAAAPPDKG